MASCEGKKRHTTLAAAEKEAKKLNSPFARAYPCYKCNGFHVGRILGFGKKGDRPENWNPSMGSGEKKGGGARIRPPRRTRR